MKKEFRILYGKNLSSADGLAIDESLILSLERGLICPTLHLYTYKPCVIVGCFQNLQQSVRIDKCEALGIEMNRRHSGGGTVFMGPEQLAIAFVLPNDFPSLPKSINKLFKFLAEPLLEALKVFGISAEFEGKNDLQVNGKKIAGLAISQDSPKVTFFHVSLLLDFDIPCMLELLNLPTENFLDRGIFCFGERMTTIRGEIESSGKNPMNAAIDILVKEIKNAFEKYFATPFSSQDLSEEEKKIIERLKKEKYQNEEWIFKTRAPKKRHITLSKRTSGGLLQVHIAFSGNLIESILITGDYFSRTRDVCRLESILKWTMATESSIKKALELIPENELIYRVQSEELLNLILDAAKMSKPGGEKVKQI